MADKTNSCPWCQGMAYVESNGERWRVWHDCDMYYGVSIVTNWHKSRRDAIFAWNNRMSESGE